MATLADGAPLTGERPLILCMHPHGFFPVATNHNLGFERSGVVRAIPAVLSQPAGLAVAVASFCFYVPGTCHVTVTYSTVSTE